MSSNRFSGQQKHKQSASDTFIQTSINNRNNINNNNNNNNNNISGYDVNYIDSQPLQSPSTSLWTTPNHPSRARSMSPSRRELSEYAASHFPNYNLTNNSSTQLLDQSLSNLSISDEYTTEYQRQQLAALQAKQQELYLTSLQITQQQQQLQNLMDRQRQLMHIQQHQQPYSHPLNNQWNTQPTINNISNNSMLPNITSPPGLNSYLQDQSQPQSPSTPYSLSYRTNTGFKTPQRSPLPSNGNSYSTNNNNNNNSNNNNNNNNSNNYSASVSTYKNFNRGHRKTSSLSTVVLSAENISPPIGTDASINRSPSRTTKLFPTRNSQRYDNYINNIQNSRRETSSSSNGSTSQLSPSSPSNTKNINSFAVESPTQVKEKNKSFKLSIWPSSSPINSNGSSIYNNTIGSRQGINNFQAHRRSRSTNLNGMGLMGTLDSSGMNNNLEASPNDNSNERSIGENNKTSTTGNSNINSNNKNPLRQPLGPPSMEVLLADPSPNFSSTIRRMAVSRLVKARQDRQKKIY